MALAAVTILMDTLYQHFLQPKPRFTLRINKRFVTSLYQNLCFLQTSLEEDSTLKNKYDEAMKDLEALIRDNCVEIRFHVEQQLSLFYLGKAMKVRLQSAQKLVPILNRAINDTETADLRSVLDKLVKHFTLPVLRMPAHIEKRAKSLCKKLEFWYLSNDEQKMSCSILIKAKSVIIQELRASYLKKYKQQQIQTRQRLREIFTMGVKLTYLIKKKQLKVKSTKNSQNHNNTASIGGLERENIASGVSSLQHTIKMVGCDDEFSTVMGKLKRESSRQEIVPIVGAGGIGKTTLARRIYGDASMISHFDCQAWVTISQQYNPRQVKESLLHSLGSGNIEASEDHLDEQVYRYLKRQRYFIVLDDIWSKDVWSDLRICFPEDNNGSRMLLTTRLKSVAEYASPGSNSYHNMRFLNLDESWNLFHNKVSEKITLFPEFEKIAREIVQKCKGLPLAITVAAGVLSNSKQTIEEWKYIAKNVSTLSLDHSDEIVYIWLSEGLLKIVRSKSLEDVARECIQDLVDRNLIQICTENHIGRTNDYQMHDVLRELALREAEKENLLRCLDYDAICLRHGRTLPINIYPKAHDQQWVIRSRMCSSHFSSHCRNFSSIFWLWDYPEFMLPSSSVSANFKLLRALILDTIQLDNISIFTVIMGLVHLRYLVFKTRLNIKFLPWFMLWNLQSLQVYNGITDEPLAICRLPHLRHLHFSHSIRLVPPRSVQDNLETISWLDYRSCTKEFFMKIPKLTKLGVRGTIICPIIRESNWVESNWVECFVNLLVPQVYGKGCEEYNWYENLVYLYKLQELDICGKIVGQRFSSVHSMGMLSVESFLPNLTNLALYFTELEWKDMDVVGALPKLEVLELTYAVNGQKWEPKDGGFLRLKYLCINSPHLVYWEAKSDHFPVLEHLALNLCIILKEIPNGFSDIATLQSIKLCKCSDSVITSAEHIRDEQQEFGNDAFVLHIDQDMYEWYSGIRIKLGF